MNRLVERCAATSCGRDADGWRYTPRRDGIVPACIAHDLDILCGATTIREDAPVIERQRRRRIA